MRCERMWCAVFGSIQTSTQSDSDKVQQLGFMRCFVTFVVAIAIWPPATVYAQELEEIVVTARKREERLQDAPLSITAFSDDQISAAGFDDLEDIAIQTPGLDFNTDLGFRTGRLNSSMRFRGIIGGGTSAFQTGNLFVDGVFVLNAAQSLALVDLERVEVIKGPQSAIYGRNTFAGAINYITKDPNMTELEGKVSVDVGQHDFSVVSGSVEGPLIVDKLSGRVGFRSYNKGAMWTAVDGGALGEQTSDSIFLTLQALPTNALKLRFRAFYQEDNDGPAALAAMTFVGDNIVNDTCTGTSRSGFDSDGNPTTVFPTRFWCGTLPSPGDPRAPRIDLNTNLMPLFRSFVGDVDGDGRDNSTFLHDFLLTSEMLPDAPDINRIGITRDLMRLSLSADYTFDNGMTATGIVAYNENKAGSVRDFDQTPLPGFFAFNPQTGEDKSIDLRLASSGERRFRWLVGFNYYEQEFFTSDTAGDLVGACGNFAGLATGNFCDFPIFLPIQLTGSDLIDVWGVYTLLSYDISDNWTVDLEGRYQEDKRSDGISDLSETFEDFIPRASISYHPNQAVTVYGSVAQGVLPGVVNGAFIACGDVPFTEPFISPITGQPSLSTECEQWREQLGDSVSPTTNTQTLDSYEIGIKGSFLDGRLSANLALYKMKWEGQTFTQTVQVVRDDNNDGIPNVNSNFLAASVEGDSEYQGIELEAQLLITDSWRASGGLSYNDSELNKLFIGGNTTGGVDRAGTDNLKGNRASRFPEWSGHVSTTYERDLASSWSLFVRGDINFQGETYTGQTNLAKLEDYHLVNARVGIENEDVRLEVYVENLFDEDKWRAGNDGVDFSTVTNGVTAFTFTEGMIILMPQDKRTLGIRATYHF